MEPEGETLKGFYREYLENVCKDLQVLLALKDLWLSLKTMRGMVAKTCKKKRCNDVGRMERELTLPWLVSLEARALL